MKIMRLLLIPLLTLSYGCGEQMGGAVGDLTTIVVVAPQPVWDAIGDSVRSALEPRIYTVRDERTFNVSHVTPEDATWPDLRVLRQVIAFGTADAPWVEPITDGEAAPGVVQTNRAWARNQLAIAAVLPSPGDTAAALALVDRVAAVMDSSFRADVISRMYTSRPDTVLRDRLQQEHGFSVLVPNVYVELERDPGVHMFQSSTTVGGELVRSVTVTSREGLIEPTAEAAIAWRDSIGATQYPPPQETVRDRIDARPVSVNGLQGIEIQGAWRGTDPSWPAGGPFLARMIPCPEQNRTYMIDTWLYAPSGRRSKYEYQVQLQTIMDTFECGSQ